MMNKKNIRHEIDKEKIISSISLKVKRLKKDLINRIDEEKRIHLRYKKELEEGKAENWSKPRIDLTSDLREIEDNYNSMIKKEEEYYSKVRIIELPEGEKRFVLVYGEKDDMEVTSGTGPFISIEKAEKWFSSQGR